MKRYEHIDIAKGIGILLVVFFHLPNIDKLALFAYWGGGLRLSTCLCSLH